MQNPTGFTEVISLAAARNASTKKSLKNGRSASRLSFAKITDNLEGEFTDGEFFVTSCSGQGLGDDTDRLYTITWNETTSSITAGVNELQLIASNGTGGTFTITYSAQTTTARGWDDTAAEIQTALEALSNLAPGDVLVTGVAGQWYVEFMGTLANTNVAQMTVDNTSLTGGDAAVVTIRAGAAAS